MPRSSCRFFLLLSLLCVLRHRSANAVVVLTAACISSWVFSRMGMWSSAMATSLLRSCCICMLSSGRMMTFAPLYGFLKCMPSLVVFSQNFLLYIWNPPESVKIIPL